MRSHPLRGSGKLLGAFIFALFAALGDAGDARAGSSLRADGLHVPSGALVDPNGRTWVSDHIAGFCRLSEPGLEGAGKLQHPRYPDDTEDPTCLGGLLADAQPGPDAAGQPLLVDPSPEFPGSGDEVALIPDRMTRSSDIIRAAWDPETGLFRYKDRIATVGDRTRPTSVVMGPDEHVYVGFQREVNVQRIRDAASGAPKAEVVGFTSDGRGAMAIAAGRDQTGRITIYLAEKLGGLRQLYPSAPAPPTAEPTPYRVPATGAEAVAMVGAMNFDPERRHLYVGTAGADVFGQDEGADVLVRYDTQTGNPEPEVVARDFTAIGGVTLRPEPIDWPRPANARVMVGDDTATINPAEPLGFGRIHEVGGPSAKVQGPATTSSTNPIFRTSGDGTVRCAFRRAGTPVTQWETCPSDGGERQFGDQGAGEYLLTVRSDLADGSTGIPKTHRVVIDQSAPGKPQVRRPSGTVSASPWFEFAAERGARFQCRFDGGAWEDCAPGRTRTYAEGGEKRLAIKAIDRAGNESETSDEVAFTVDPALETSVIPPVFGPAGAFRSKSLAADELHISAGGLYDPNGRLWIADHEAGFCRVSAPGTEGAGKIEHPHDPADEDTLRTCLGGLRPHAGTGPDAAGQPALIDPTPAKPGNGDEIAFIPDGASPSAEVVRTRWNPDTGLFVYLDTVSMPSENQPRPTVVAVGPDPDGPGLAQPPLYVATKENAEIYRISDPASGNPSVQVVARTSDGKGPLSLAAGFDANGTHVLYVGEPDAGVTKVVPRVAATAPRTTPTGFTFPAKPNATPEEPENGFAALIYDQERNVLYVGMGNAGEPADDGIDPVHRVDTRTGAVTADWSTGYTVIGGFALRPDGDLMVFDDPALIDPAEPLGTGRMFDVGGSSARVSAGPLGDAGPSAEDPRFTADPTPSFRVTGDATLKCIVRPVGERAPADMTAPQWQDCSKGEPFTVAAPGLADGDHLLTVRSVEGDVLGIPETYRFTVDTKAPAAPVITSPTAGAGKHLASPWFAFSTDERRVRYECRLDEGATTGTWGTCVPGRTFSFTTDGERTLTVRAIDRAGQTSPESAPVTFDVDGTLPTVTIAAPEENLRTKATEHVLRFKASEAGGDYGCRVDGERFALCNATPDAEGYASRTFRDLGHGTHVFQVRARDANRNVGPLAERRIHVDLQGPEVDIAAPVEAAMAGRTPALRFATTPESTHGDERHTFECSVNGGAWRSCSSGDALSELAGAPLSGGENTVAVRGTDDLGNVGVEAVRRFQVDATGPVVAFAAPSPGESAQVSSAPIFVWDANEAVETYRCWLDDQELAGCTSPRGMDGLAHGWHTFTVQGIDRFGNAGERLTRRFEVVRASPVPPVLVLDPRTGAQVPLESLQLDRRVKLDRLLSEGLPLMIRPVEGSTLVRLRIFKVEPVRVRAAAAAAGKKTRRVLVATAFKRASGGRNVKLVLRERAVRRLKPGRYVIEMRSAKSRTKLVGRTLTRTFEVRR